MICNQIFLCFIAVLSIYFHRPQAVITDGTSIKIYLSPLSTLDKIKEVEKTAQDLGFDIHFDEIAFDDKGILKSFSTKISVLCLDETLDHSSTHDLSETYPLGIIFVGKACQHGAMVTSISNEVGHSKKEEMFDNFIFTNGEATYEIFGWNGDLGDLKE